MMFLSATCDYAFDIYSVMINTFFTLLNNRNPQIILYCLVLYRHKYSYGYNQMTYEATKLLFLYFFIKFFNSLQKNDIRINFFVMILKWAK